MRCAHHHGLRPRDGPRHHIAQGRPLLRPLVNPGLSVADDRRIRRAALAEAVPTLENGLWATTPDGRMETTWTIREGVRWHDGTPFTTDDLLFTATVGRDREVAILNNAAWASVDDVTALDERTLTIRWREPYIYADRGTPATSRSCKPILTTCSGGRRSTRSRSASFSTATPSPPASWPGPSTSSSS